MTRNLHMSGIIMYGGGAARTALAELAEVIPVLWQSPFSFHWWDSTGMVHDGVMPTLSKRGLSQPPEAFRGEGGFEAAARRCERVTRGVYQLEKFQWLDQLLMKKCRSWENDPERENTPVRAATVHKAQWGTLKVPGGMCLTVLKNLHFLS